MKNNLFNASNAKEVQKYLFSMRDVLKKLFLVANCE